MISNKYFVFNQSIRVLIYKSKFILVRIFVIHFFGINTRIFKCLLVHKLLYLHSFLKLHNINLCFIFILQVDYRGKFVGNETPNGLLPVMMSKILLNLWNIMNTSLLLLFVSVIDNNISASFKRFPLFVVLLLNKNLFENKNRIFFKFGFCFLYLH